MNTGLTDNYGRFVDYLRDALMGPVGVPIKPLVAARWIDVSGLPLQPGEATTVGQALTDLYERELTAAYQTQITDRLTQFPGSRSPLDLEGGLNLREIAEAVAKARLDRFEAALDKFLATEPDDEQIVKWLTDRMLSDAENWSRMDTLAMRDRADADFYQDNPDLRQGQFTVQPDTAVCPACQAIAGQVYSSYDEARDALDDAWHPNCVHAVEAYGGD